MKPPTGARGDPAHLLGLLLLVSSLVVPTVGACKARPPRPKFFLPVAAQAWVPTLPATHDPLSGALAAFAEGGQVQRWGRGRDDAFRDYLATLARNGPASRPELFPAADDVLAYLVDAHVAWTLALGRSADLRSAGVSDLRTAPIPLDGRVTSLEGIAGDLARRAPGEPRLALFLNPGWRGGPPFPESAVEGRALDWQVARHAERCGRAAGFWALDTARARLAVSAYSELMWGLPPGQPARARRLLDLVPPAPALLDAVLKTCGTGLQRCTVVLAPMDPGRLVVPEKSDRDQSPSGTGRNRPS